uniref:PDZ domain-containing protein n=1 Tax=Meloidogyne floridensis TaxID=298350 RepID=A0A915P5Y3_9BILA
MAINSAEDFTAATQHSGAQPKRLFIRFRRDDYFRMINLKGSNIIVSNIEPSSVAAQYIFPGDILLDVNGKEVNNDVSAAKKAIRQSIAEKKNVVLRLERDGPPLKLISTPAEDVVEILTRAKGFWNKRCRLIPIEEEEPRKLKKVYHAPNVESEPFPVDETGKKLVATPSRDGGTRTEEPMETAEEEHSHRGGRILKR